VVTVEEFLRRTTDKLKPTKVYRGRKRRRIVDLAGQVQGDDDNRLRFPESEVNVFTESPELRRLAAASQQPGSPISQSPGGGGERSIRRPRRYKPLAPRIFQAAVLSHANANQILECRESNPTSSRRPLSFVKENTVLGTPGVTKKRRTLMLVDPRRISPFRQAAFSSQNPNKLDLTNGMLSTDVGAHIGYQDRLNSRPFTKHKARAKKLPVCVSNCPPLSFVPLVDAERIPAIG
jgi:hypothetical protein